jgi:glycosyltransferase involved in cell wall biosynthesis
LRIVHVIAGLSVGGAETMLCKLLSVSGDSPRDAEVISLTDIGPVGERIKQQGVPVRALGMSRGRPAISGLFRLRSWLRQSAPDLVQTWMYHADLVGGLAARLAGKIPVVWGIRNGVLEPHGNKRMTIWTAQTSAKLSRWLPDRIVCCSESARRFHEAMGYQSDKMSVIPNGFDVSTFKPDHEARAQVRQELQAPPNAVLIGLVARWDPQKDHQNFLRAAGRLASRRSEVRFVLCGDGITGENEQLAASIAAAGIGDRCHLLGRRGDVQRLTASLDIATCSSYAEAFPNVLGEAMACGVPCASTDAGDAALIIGDTGIVVPTRNPMALADAWLKLIEMGSTGRRQLGLRARQRIQDQFDLTRVNRRYLELYRRVLSDKTGRQS